MTKKSDHPAPSAVVLEFVQPEDGAGRAGHSVQSIRIEMACSTANLADDGYLVISTERWAFSKPADLLALLDKVAQVVAPRGEAGATRALNTTTESDGQPRSQMTLGGLISALAAMPAGSKVRTLCRACLYGVDGYEGISFSVSPNSMSRASEILGDVMRCAQSAGDAKRVWIAEPGEFGVRLLALEAGGGMLTDPALPSQGQGRTA